MKNKIQFCILTLILCTATLPVLKTFPAATSTINSITENYEHTIRRCIDPELLNISEPSKIIMLISKNADVASISKKMFSSRLILVGNIKILLGVADSETIWQLANNNEVLAIFKDRKIEYSTFDQKFHPTLEMQVLQNTVPKPTLREAINITGAQKAWETYKIYGNQTTIAIVDTGVDYGSPALNYPEIIPKDNYGAPSMLDADGECLAITNITITKTFTLNGKDKWLETNSTDPPIYASPLVSKGIIPPIITWSNITGSSFPSPMNITGIMSKSGEYHFGIMYQYLGDLGDVFFPVIIVDSHVSGVYDEAYIDLSFGWWQLGFAGSSTPDYSFADEKPVTINSPIASRDFTGDTIPDLSAGSISYFLDVWGASPNAYDKGLILKPIDPNGNYIAMVNDWFGHGTFCTSIAAGRDFQNSKSGSGIAPGAKIMGITALYIGDIIEAWLWASGFDLIPGTEGWQTVPSYGTVYGTWQYTGNHKADIISNSWGFSDWAPWLQQQGLPFYDILTMLEDALTVPGYLDPEYLGTVMIHAGGNGGPGYGTITEPSFSTLPITVGATTSLNATGEAFGIAGGRFDDVISWSARGPTPTGNVKPDVVNVGAYAWAAGPTWLGRGNGLHAFDIFGGTSMATPLTAGAAALIINAYTQAHEVKPSPETVKIILKSSAKDLGYDPFVQGAGRVDALKAVKTALDISGIITSSTATWENIKQRIDYSWVFYRAFESSQQDGFTPPQASISDTGWYAGIVSPNESATAQFTVENLSNQTTTVTINPVKYSLIKTETYQEQTENLPLSWQNTSFTWGYMLKLNKTTIPEDAELMKASVTMTYENFDPDSDNVWNERCGILILDWIDKNGDSEIDPTETYNVNYGYNYGTSSEASVGFPQSKIQGQPAILIYQRNQTENLHSVPFTIHIAYYSRQKWNWIETPEYITINAKSSLAFNATIKVPENASQGAYEGQIAINATELNDKAIMIPISIQVPTAISGEELTQYLSSPNQQELYDPYQVNGYFDWAWRYESGDWKQWILNIQNREIVKAFVTCNWTKQKTDIDMFTINPLGFPEDASFSPNINGDGCFQWHTRTGTNEEYVNIDTSWIFNPMSGTYTVLLHNVLFEGSSFPEAISGKVQLVKLSPRGPLTLTVKPGQTAQQEFTLTSGRDLTNLAVYGFSTFTVQGNPTHIEKLNAGESVKFSVKINVPKETPEGTYNVMIAFTATEFSDSPAYAIINLTVDNTPPTINVLSPQNNSITFGNMTLEAYIEDSGGVQNVTFNAGTSTYEMLYNNMTGHYIANLSTLTLPDGQVTIRIVAADKAGNEAEINTTIIVDNTQPSASINWPSNNTFVKEIVTLNITGIDENLLKTELYANNTMLTMFEKNGTYTCAWNTSTLKDGIYTLTLMVFDKAQHVSESQTTLTVDNTAPSATIVWPTNGSYIKGQVNVTFTYEDENLEEATLKIDSLEYNVTERKEIPLNTTNLSDGPHTIALYIKDKAGNTNEKTSTFLVDNTPPSIEITSPSNQTKLYGTTTIQFSTEDQILSKALLYIDQVAINVTGQNSYQWDTTKTGDGLHTIRIVATDLAGNQAEKQITISTANTEMATSESHESGYKLGLIIGSLIGLLIGAVAVFFLNRKILKPQPIEK